MIENPQSFIVAEECKKAAWQHGYRQHLGEESGWSKHRSTTAKGTIYLAATGSSGPWFLALDHVGVIHGLERRPDDISGPGISRYSFAEIRDLYALLSQIYRLACTLSDPLLEYRAKTHNLPQTTEAERIRVERIGQGIFRNSLMVYWQGCCPLTGISDHALLRASHIIPWRECADDAERLNVDNGLLLSALWDAAFDRGLVTFDNEGCPAFSPTLSSAAKSQLSWHASIPLTDNHRERLAWHRENIFGKCGDGT